MPSIRAVYGTPLVAASVTTTGVGQLDVGTGDRAGDGRRERGRGVGGAGAGDRLLHLERPARELHARPDRLDPTVGEARRERRPDSETVPRPRVRHGDGHGRTVVAARRRRRVDRAIGDRQVGGGRQHPAGERAEVEEDPDAGHERVGGGREAGPVRPDRGRAGRVAGEVRARIRRRRDLPGHRRARGERIRRQGDRAGELGREHRAAADPREQVGVTGLRQHVDDRSPRSPGRCRRS